MDYAEEDLREAEKRFCALHPEYAAAETIDRLRENEYARLDDSGHVYLDYTGGGQYAESQLRSHHEWLSANVLGNPHSHNPSSLAATRYVEETRMAVHEFFSADEEEYDVVFTANASHALKLVGEAYPFTPGSCYLISYDNHNSVNGIREFARRKGARVIYVPVRKPDLRLDERLVMRGMDEEGSAQAPRLFAYPAQSNFSGVQHPLEWIEVAHAKGWDVLLDSAAFIPTNRLDLSEVHPDFVSISFYKMFGYPTGIGALIARRKVLEKLERPWFAGGTITLASVQGEGWYHLSPGHAGFEDGTVDYLGLPAVKTGLEHIASIGIETIHDRVVALTDWLLEEMLSLRHANGAPMVRIFGPESTQARGATIAFYILDPEGAVYDVHQVERLAGERMISVRTGCFCNPGDGEVAHEIEREEMERCFTESEHPVTFKQCHDLIRDTSGKVPNTIRASFGIASNFADAYRLMRFIATFRDMPTSDMPVI